MDTTSHLSRLGAWGAMLALVGYVLLPSFRLVVEAITGSSENGVFAILAILLFARSRRAAESAHVR